MLSEGGFLLRPLFLACRQQPSHCVLTRPVLCAERETIIVMCMRAKSFQSCLTLCGPMDCSPPGSSVHGDSPGKNVGVGCHALLQGIFLAQGLNLYLLHRRQILYLLIHRESPISV